MDDIMELVHNAVWGDDRRLRWRSNGYRRLRIIVR